MTFNPLFAHDNYHDNARETDSRISPYKLDTK